MRKDQVLAAEVEIEAGSQGMHAHGAAFDVPAGAAFAPWAWPEDGAVIGDARLPEGEIGQGILGVFVVADAGAGAHLLEVQMEQLAIAAAAVLVFPDAEIDRAIRRAISHPAGHQRFDQGDDLRDMLRGAGRLVRTQAVQAQKILKKRGLKFRGVLGQRCLVLAHALDDFVLNVGDIHDVADVEALELQIPAQQVGKNEGAEVADMGEVMHRRAAAIESHVFAVGMARDKFLDRS